jgi:uncharacterized protein YbbC (DUF1343 family)/CubicO group peptidase (beta-lactamase class C family)
VSTRCVRCLRRQPLAALLVLSMTSAVAGPPQLDPRNLGFQADVLAEIDAVVEQGIADGEMAGAVICIGRSDGIGFLKAYGDRQVKPSREAMTTDTVFDLASLTKPIATATAVMKLIDEGKVAPEDRVAKHLPEFGKHGKEEITVAQLLTHTGGLIADNALRDYNDGPEKAWERICDLKLTAEPGTRFLYTDVGFIVLGKLVERISGKALQEFCREAIFEPLGMAETGFLPNDELKRRAAATERISSDQEQWYKGTVHDPRAARLGGVAGHAGLFSTAEDLARYATAMLHTLEGKRSPLFDVATAKLMIEPRDVPRGRRTFGWDNRTGYSSNRGRGLSSRAFGHGGFTGTAIWIDPELDLYIIWLSNRLHPDGRGTVNPLAGQVGTIAARALMDRTVANEARYRASTANVSPVLTGIDVLKRDGFSTLKGRKVGLITNHTGQSREGESTVKLFAEADGVDLVALFSPEHGFDGRLDVSRIADTEDPTTGLIVYSLYGETRTPTAAMLADLDTLVFDIQDVGVRFYTYVSTMRNAMKAAAEHGKRFVVLDRPNPINGIDVEGPILDAGRESFVGFHTVPVRHGMTIGELATLFKHDLELKLDLQVVKMEGWRRGDFFDGTALTWVNPSPNMRSLTQATLYPGIGLLETTNLSVGRGTDTPFEVIGAPWLDGVKLATALNNAGLPGVRFVPIRFTPTGSKFQGEECGGVNILITDRAVFRPVTTGLAIAVQLRRDFADGWDPRNYDRLLINQQTYDAVVAGRSVTEIEAEYQDDVKEFLERRRPHLLYE